MKISNVKRFFKKKFFRTAINKIVLQIEMNQVSQDFFWKDQKRIKDQKRSIIIVNHTHVYILNTYTLQVSSYLPLKVIHFIMNLRTNNKAFYLSRYSKYCVWCSACVLCAVYTIYDVHVVVYAVYTVYYLLVILTLFLTQSSTLQHPSPLPVLTRHGQSEYNAIGRIGGDSGLSGHGVAYAKALGDFVAKKVSSSQWGSCDGQREDVCLYSC